MNTDQRELKSKLATCDLRTSPFTRKRTLRHPCLSRNDCGRSACPYLLSISIISRRTIRVAAPWRD